MTDDGWGNVYQYVDGFFARTTRQHNPPEVVRSEDLATFSCDVNDTEGPSNEVKTIPGKQLYPMDRHVSVFSHRITVDLCDASTKFEFMGWMSGKNDEFLWYIHSETGVKLRLHESWKPSHAIVIILFHADKNVIMSALDLINDLIDMVMDEYDRWCHTGTNRLDSTKFEHYLSIKRIRGIDREMGFEWKYKRDEVLGLVRCDAERLWSHACDDEVKRPMYIDEFNWTDVEVDKQMYDVAERYGWECDDCCRKSGNYDGRKPFYIGTVQWDEAKHDGLFCSAECFNSFTIKFAPERYHDRVRLHLAGLPFIIPELHTAVILWRNLSAVSKQLSTSIPPRHREALTMQMRSIASYGTTVWSSDKWQECHEMMPVASDTVDLVTLRLLKSDAIGESVVIKEDKSNRRYRLTAVNVRQKIDDLSWYWDATLGMYDGYAVNDTENPSQTGNRRKHSKTMKRKYRCFKCEDLVDCDEVTWRELADLGKEWYKGAVNYRSACRLQEDRISVRQFNDRTFDDLYSGYKASDSINETQKRSPGLLIADVIDAVSTPYKDFSIESVCSASHFDETFDEIMQKKPRLYKIVCKSGPIRLCATPCIVEPV